MNSPGLLNPFHAEYETKFCENSVEIYPCEEKRIKLKAFLKAAKPIESYLI